MVPNIEFYREVDLGSLKIEICIHENQGYRVYFTARDNEDRRIWRTPLTDGQGLIRTYRSLSDAIADADDTIENSLGKVTLASMA